MEELSVPASSTNGYDLDLEQRKLIFGRDRAYRL